MMLHTECNNGGIYVVVKDQNLCMMMLSTIINFFFIIDSVNKRSIVSLKTSKN